MKQFMFWKMLRSYFAPGNTAQLASARIRAVLKRDRETECETKWLDAELSAVLARYFTVMDFTCQVENDVRTNRIFYTLQAELVK